MDWDLASVETLIPVNKQCQKVWHSDIIGARESFNKKKKKLLSQLQQNPTLLTCCQDLITKVTMYKCQVVGRQLCAPTSVVRHNVWTTSGEVGNSQTSLSYRFLLSEHNPGCILLLVSLRIIFFTKSSSILWGLTFNKLFHCVEIHQLRLIFGELLFNFFVLNCKIKKSLCVHKTDW